MDFERNDGDAARRWEAERGLPIEPRIEGDPYVRDDTPTGTRGVGSGTHRGGVGLEEEARVEESVRRGAAGHR